MDIIRLLSPVSVVGGGCGVFVNFQTNMFIDAPLDHTGGDS